MRALVINDFLTESERAQLCSTALDLKNEGVLQQNPGGPLRYRKKIHGTRYCDSVMHSVSDRIRNFLHIENCAVDPNLGWIISLIEPGGFIKTHIDAHANYTQSGDIHLRCNVLVQGANESCYPVIDNVVHAVEERGLWAFFASRYFHGTRPVEGPLPRIVYQFGFVVPKGFQLDL